MPLETNLNISPYFDDYDQLKDFYRILFKPSVAVQVRELNQLQQIIQTQFERLGEHLFKSGTIVSGVNFSYIPNYNYVKIEDVQTNGQTALPGSYVNLLVRNSANLVARVINYEDGLESTDPDLKTLYLRYMNGGNTGSMTSFTSSEILTVFDSNYPVFTVSVNAASTGLSNASPVIFMPQIAVLPTSANTIGVGEQIVSGTKRARVVGVDTTFVAGYQTLKLAPLTADAANGSFDANNWIFEIGDAVTSNATSSTAEVTHIFGYNAAARLITTTEGSAEQIVITNFGSDYMIPPYVFVQPSTSDLVLTAQNYLCQIRVANTDYANAVGTGYAVSISDGIIYQKGHFLRVNPQITVVNKYSSQPDNVSLGFTTVETKVTSDADESLLDNSLGTFNYTAPGADRLRLTPILVSANTDLVTGNSEFLPLVEFKDGQPFKEFRNTLYNVIAKEFEKRTAEASGDFVLDPFLVTTQERGAGNNAVANATHYNVVVDPGLAYIGGTEVKTNTRVGVAARRGTDTGISTNLSLSTNYGNYILVRELAGNFPFYRGATVSLYDTAQQKLTSGVPVTGALSPTGTAIGTARVRSLVPYIGTPGTPEASYKLYLFDITMSSGKNFRDVRAVFANTAGESVRLDGIADSVTIEDGSSGSQITKLYGFEKDSLVFPIAVQGTKNANNINIKIRSSKTAALAANGIFTLDVSAAGLKFPGTINPSDITLFPLANSEQGSAITQSGAPTIANGATSNVVGTGTAFVTDLVVGGYVKIGNSSIYDVGRVTSIVNNTFMVVGSNLSTVTNSTSGSAIKRFYPAGYPIDLSVRSRSLSVEPVLQQVLTVDIQDALAAQVNAIAVTSFRRINATPATKSVYRQAVVKISCANSTYSNGASNNYNGPWSLGVPDVFRLRGVYYGSNTVNANTSGQNVTRFFYVDNGQTSDYYGGSQLVKIPNSNLNLFGNDSLLIVFDCFTRSAEGFFARPSYPVDNTKILANSATTISEVEIPEFLDAVNYYDLRDSFDFRPYKANTVALTTVEASAPINPGWLTDFSVTDKEFPQPDADVDYDLEYYLGRADRVIVRKTGEIDVVEGKAGLPGIRSLPPPVADSLTIATLSIPPYPSHPKVLMPSTEDFIFRLVGNKTVLVDRRTARSRIKTIETGDEYNRQPHRYTMAEIGSLERRIENLERQVTLSATEKSLSELTIPSSLSPTMNRFKFGFFVDDFTSTAFSNYVSVDMTATVDLEKQVLAPKTMQFGIPYQFDRSDATTRNALDNGTGDDGTIMFPYTEEVVVQQQLASYIPTSTNTTPTITPPPTISPNTRPTSTTTTQTQPTVTRDVVYPANSYTNYVQKPEPASLTTATSTSVTILDSANATSTSTGTDLTETTVVLTADVISANGKIYDYTIDYAGVLTTTGDMIRYSGGSTSQSTVNRPIAKAVTYNYSGPAGTGTAQLVGLGAYNKYFYIEEDGSETPISVDAYNGLMKNYL